MTWDQRHWLEDFNTFPKCPRTWSKLKNWARYALWKLGNFWIFWKVNKNTFWVKASYMNMEDPIEMRPKGLLRGHPKLSKKSNNTSLGLKLEEICLVKDYHFCKIAKSQICSKLHFLPNGPNLLCLHLTYNMVTTQIFTHMLFASLFILF